MLHEVRQLTGADVHALARRYLDARIDSSKPQTEKDLRTAVGIDNTTIAFIDTLASVNTAACQEALVERLLGRSGSVKVQYLSRAVLAVGSGPPGEKLTRAVQDLQSHALLSIRHQALLALGVFVSRLTAPHPDRAEGLSAHIHDQFDAHEAKLNDLFPADADADATTSSTTTTISPATTTRPVPDLRDASVHPDTRQVTHTVT